MRASSEVGEWRARTDGLSLLQLPPRVNCAARRTGPQTRTKGCFGFPDFFFDLLLEAVPESPIVMKRNPLAPSRMLWLKGIVRDIVAALVATTHIVPLKTAVARSFRVFSKL